MVTRLRALTIVALLIALVGGLPGIAAPAKAAPRTVRVATHDIEPFVMSHDNLKSGFTIDILDQIAKHEGWTFEYVDVANAFVDRDETGMVNAVLDLLARGARTEEFGPAQR